MKYNDLSTVETEITKNDYVTYDIKQKRKGRLNLKKHNFNLKTNHQIFNILLIPLVVGTVISLGFLIAQVAEYATLVAVANSLNLGL